MSRHSPAVKKRRAASRNARKAAPPVARQPVVNDNLLGWEPDIATVIALGADRFIAVDTDGCPWLAEMDVDDDALIHWTKLDRPEIFGNDAQEKLLALKNELRPKMEAAGFDEFSIWIRNAASPDTVIGMEATKDGRPFEFSLETTDIDAFAVHARRAVDSATMAATPPKVPADA
jgi:hypothetical protein